jgi:hypothetical protein
MVLGWAWGLPFSQVGAQGTVAVFSAPEANSTLRGRVVVTGSADHANFWKYEVHFAREPVRDNWTLIGTVHEIPVRNGTLETWDTATVPDGTYSLRLRVVRKDGNYDEEYLRSLQVANALPTETPTPEVTPTATISPTPLPATPTVIISQPLVDTPTPMPSPTVGSPSSEPRPTPDLSLSLEKLSDSFCYGSGIAAVAFGGLAVLVLLRKLLLWLWDLLRNS